MGDRRNFSFPPPLLHLRLPLLLLAGMLLLPPCPTAATRINDAQGRSLLPLRALARLSLSPTLPNSPLSLLISPTPPPLTRSSTLASPPLPSFPLSLPLPLPLPPSPPSPPACPLPPPFPVSRSPGSAGAGGVRCSMGTFRDGAVRRAIGAWGATVTRQITLNATPTGSSLI
ncbi:unnamed protein product [Closterium sp. NIES-64]|nr:unnamed protein product [Closterium sp. NIES-64]